jgi:hypothetical protein
VDASPPNWRHEPDTALPCAVTVALFMLSADWRMQDGFEDNIQRLTTGLETGQVLTARAPAPHAGHP